MVLSAAGFCRGQKEKKTLEIRNQKYATHSSFSCRPAPGIQTLMDKDSFSACAPPLSINEPWAQGLSLEWGPCQQPPPLPSQPPRSRSASTRLASLGSPAPANPSAGGPAAGVARGKPGMLQAPRACHTGRQEQKYQDAASPFARPQTSLAPDAGGETQQTHLEDPWEPWVPVLLSSSTGPPPKPPNGFLKFLEQNPPSDRSSFL